MTAPHLAWRPGATPATLRRRAEALATARAFFAARGVLECETPILVERPVSDPKLGNLRCQLGLRPDATYYLHTSPEYHMKRLLAAGSPDLYQICKAFRDGELGARHLAEFTLIEWYRHQISFDAIVAETCDLVAAIAGCWQRSVGRPSRHGYGELFVEFAGLDPLVAGAEEIRQAGERLLPGVVSPQLAASLGADRAAWLDLLLTGVIEPRLRGLVVVDRYPAEQAALARLDARDPRVAERFEVYLDGLELANGYHELADGAEQRRRFEADRRERARLGLPDTPPDDRLLAALESDPGLPDCCGVALGFDRLLMACGNYERIDAVVAFKTPEDE